MELILEGVRTSLGKKEILHGLNLTLADGEFLALLGASGCGKSTCLKSIAGILPLNGGTIWLGGREITHVPPHQRGTVVVFQDLRLFPHMNAAENVAFPLRMQGTSQRRQKEQAEHWLREVQLEGLGARRVSELSGGQLQRVALARALAAQPQVLLLDEPFSSLDENLREEMRALVSSLQKSLHMTTILVTHDRREALSMADRVAVMFEGDIEQCDTPQQVYTRPATRRVADYFGGGGYLSGEVAGGVFTGGAISFSVQEPDGAWDAFLRPDALEIGAHGPLVLTVEGVRYQGEGYQSTLVGPAGLRLMYSGNATLGQPGERLSAKILGQRVVLLPPK